MHTLILEQLSLTYNKKFKALDNVSLNISNGMFGLLGPNGAGKSSLMKTIVGLQKPNTGRILFDGYDIVKHPELIRKQLGFLPQDFGVYPKVNAYDLLNHMALLKGITDARLRKKQINDLLGKLNLYQSRYKDVDSFSGGMKQRFGIAQALLGDPNIIIVDEPSAGLDPEERNRFNFLLNEISEDIIVILSTHLVEEVRNLCDQMAIIRHGKILKTGEPEILLNDLKGKLWWKQIDKTQLDYHRTTYTVINQQLVGKKLRIDVIEDHQPEGFMPLEPELSHVYFHHLEKAGH